jgi:hypothetical protein
VNTTRFGSMSFTPRLITSLLPGEEEAYAGRPTNLGSSPARAPGPPEAPRVWSTPVRALQAPRENRISCLPAAAPERAPRSGPKAPRGPSRIRTARTLLILEERLKEQQAEGVRMPEGMALDELALRILMDVETGQVPGGSRVVGG